MTLPIHRIEEEQRLRDLCNSEGIQRARAGEITARQYKNDYYAPTIRAQFRVREIETGMKESPAAPREEEQPA